MRSILVSASVLFGLAFFVANVSGQEEEAAPTASPAAEEVAVDDVVEDSMITDRLKKILDSTEWFQDVEVVSENGVVTISGVSDTDGHRQWAEDLAARTEDVVATINKIETEKAVDIGGSADVVGQSLQNLWEDFLARTPFLIAALLMVVLTWIVSTAIGWLLPGVLDRQRMRGSLKDLISLLVTIIVWVGGLLIAAVIAFPGMTPSKALAVLGLGSVAIGFAFKDIFENFFAGILILWKYPFDRGDVIKCGELVGRVQEITIRNTLIQGLDGPLIAVPNAEIFKSSVEVLTHQPHRRVRIDCGVAYGEDVDHARKTIESAVKQCDTHNSEEAVEVFAKEFADSSINFEVCWWTGSQPKEVRASRDQVVASIKRALDEAEIEIPFPYRTLTLGDSATELLERSLNPK